MKVEKIVFKREGFPMAYGIKFENGLVLKTENLFFRGKAEREAIEAKLNRIFALLELAGEANDAS